MIDHALIERMSAEDILRIGEHIDRLRAVAAQSASQRRRARLRLIFGAPLQFLLVQLAGSLCALVGLYLLAGLAITLVVAGVGTVTVAILAEKAGLASPGKAGG